MEYKELKIVLAIHKGLPVKLKLQKRSPTNQKWFYTIGWRTLYPSGKSNRRFYNTKEDGYWNIPCDFALRLMKKAEKEGMFDSTFKDNYLRTGGGHPSFLTSKSGKRAQLLSEIILPNETKIWSSNPYFVIGVEPNGMWRKIMIVNPDKNIVTFRSMTKDRSYELIQLLQNNFGWHLDRSMIDCDPLIMRKFMHDLESIC
jgi:hypothetical protein